MKQGAKKSNILHICRYVCMYVFALRKDRQNRDSEESEKIKFLIFYSLEIDKQSGAAQRERIPGRALSRSIVSAG